MNGYQLTATCGDCGGPLHHQQATTPTPAETSALAICHDCHRQWQVTVRLLRVPNPDTLRRARHRHTVNA